MNGLAIDEEARCRLRTKRNRLLEEFFRNPSMTWLAIEIRLIDDQIAELTGPIMVKNELGSLLAGANETVSKRKLTIHSLGGKKTTNSSLARVSQR